MKITTVISHKYLIKLIYDSHRELSVACSQYYPKSNKENVTKVNSKNIFPLGKKKIPEVSYEYK